MEFMTSQKTGSAVSVVNAAQTFSHVRKGIKDYQAICKETSYQTAETFNANS